MYTHTHTHTFVFNEKKEFLNEFSNYELLTEM